MSVSPLFLVLPALFILLGAVGALAVAFSRDSKGAEADAEQPEAGLVAGKPAEAPAPLFKPHVPVVVDEKKELTFEELVASVEGRLRHEREAASAFVHRPSAEALWVN